MASARSAITEDDESDVGWLIVEMPDKKEQLFIALCRYNGGSLSERKRAKFAELDDETIAALEAVVQEVMGSLRG